MQKPFKLLSTITIFSTLTISACGANPIYSEKLIKPATAAASKQNPKAAATQLNQQDSEVSTNLSDKNEKVQYIYLVIEPNAKLGSDGKMHDAFMDGNFTVAAGKKVKVTIYNFDNKAHSITSEPLNLQVKIAASQKKGVPKVTTAEFTPTHVGTFQWHSTGEQEQDQWAMSHDGFMKGSIQVNPATDPYQHISLVVNTDYKWAPDGRLHDAYTPGNFTINKGQPVKLSIYNYDTKFHTFFTTDFINVNIMVKGTTTPGTPQITTAEFTPTQSGKKIWNCFLPCDGDNDDAAMDLNNYMWGNITVK